MPAETVNNCSQVEKNRGEELKLSHSEKYNLFIVPVKDNVLLFSIGLECLLVTIPSRTGSLTKVTSRIRSLRTKLYSPLHFLHYRSVPHPFLPSLYLATKFCQHWASIGCTENGQPIGMTVHSDILHRWVAFLRIYRSFGSCCSLSFIVECQMFFYQKLKKGCQTRLTLINIWHCVYGVERHYLKVEYTS